MVVPDCASLFTLLCQHLHLQVEACIPLVVTGVKKFWLRFAQKLPLYYLPFAVKHC